MKSSCISCSQAFETHKTDVEFYQKVSPVIGGKTLAVPPPTHCPDCRQQRRMSWRNEHTLYRSSCKNCGRAIISALSPQSPYVRFCHDCWFGDTWDGKEHGRTFDMDRPFFAQFNELHRAVPQLAVSIWNSENSDYCNYIGDVKNSYLLFGSVYSQDCYYGSPYYSKNCVDTLVIRNCERCYECVDCRELYDCSWCQDCIGSHGLLYCRDLQSCDDCIGCAGLRRKKFCIFNEQLTEAEYKKRKTELDLNSLVVRTTLQAKLGELVAAMPHRYMQSNKTEDVSGNFVYESKNAHDVYYADKCHDCRYCAQVVDLKDCHDLNFTEENELCYEYLGAYQNNRVLFSLFCNRVNESMYCIACHRSSHLFGCSGLKDASYCILNKQYTKEEYEKLVPKIVERMRKAGEWGEFFPVRFSPFGYNETVAEEYYPLTEDAVRSRGWMWNTDLPYATGKETVTFDQLPVSIADVPDSITQEILGCESCGRNYRIIPQEIAFYKSQKLPLPHACFDCRHRARIAQRNPRTLWDRQCSQCSKQILTTYSSDRPEIVYCEECYLKEVY
jgi:hypothetical protein